MVQLNSSVVRFGEAPVNTAATDRRIVFDHFSLDLVNECLWVGSEVIKVRPKAFAVLNYLINRPGQLVTKEELLTAVWPETFVTDAVLKVTVRQLREALSDDPKEPRFIETSHRRGYRFIATIGATHTSIPKPAKTVVGRDEALSQMQDWLTTTLRGQRQVVFLAGEAGIGKTALVDAFEATIPGNANIRVARGQCLEQYGTGEAYLPVLEAIDRLCRDERGVVELLRSHAPMWLLQMPSLLASTDRELLSREVAGATRERMLREMVGALDALTAEVPLVLILEDLHWSDHSTLNLISYLANQRQSAHLMVIGTYRNVELNIARHPLRALKQELLVKELCEELQLDYLGEEYVSQYLSGRFPKNRFPEGLSRLIHQRTDGNPLFMVNAVDYLVCEKLIVERDNCWELAVDIEDVELGVPDNIKQMIEKQLDHLTIEKQQTLEIASVAGVEFSSAALIAGSEEPREVIEARCDALAHDRQFIQELGITELPTGEVVTRYAFVHALYQNALYERLSQARRVQIHRRIGEGGEQVYGERAKEIAGELAMHFERGRDYLRAAKYRQQAADNAIRRFAFSEAVALAQHGIDLLENLPDSPQRVAQELCLQLTLGVPLITIEGYASPKVGEVYLRARELQKLVGDTPDISEVLWGLWTFYVLSAELRTAREIAEECLEWSDRLAYPGLGMRAHLMMHVTLMHQGEFNEAIKHYEKASALYDPIRHVEDGFFYSQNAGVALRCFVAWTLWFLGKPEKALERIEESLAIAYALDEPNGLAHASLFAAILHQLRREPRQAEKYAKDVLKVASEHGLEMYRVQASIIQAWVLAEQGQLNEAIKQMEQGIADYRETHTRLLEPHFHTLLAEVLRKNGEVDEGLREVERAIVQATKSDDCSYLAEAYRVKGDLLRESGNVTGAESCYRQSIETAREQGAMAWEQRTTLSRNHLDEFNTGAASV